MNDWVVLDTAGIPWPGRKMWLGENEPIFWVASILVMWWVCLLWVSISIGIWVMAWPLLIWIASTRRPQWQRY
jgi:hypothetical protein